VPHWAHQYCFWSSCSHVPHTAHFDCTSLDVRAGAGRRTRDRRLLKTRMMIAARATDTMCKRVSGQDLKSGSSQYGYSVRSAPRAAEAAAPTASTQPTSGLGIHDVADRRFGARLACQTTRSTTGARSG